MFDYVSLLDSRPDVVGSMAFGIEAAWQAQWSSEWEFISPNGLLNIIIEERFKRPTRQFWSERILFKKFCRPLSFVGFQTIATSLAMDQEMNWQYVDLSQLI